MNEAPPTEGVDVEAIRARASKNIAEIVDNPREYYRVQQILRDRSDLLREVDRLLERIKDLETTVAHVALNEGKCRNWPCRLDDGHKGPCSTTEVNDMDSDERDDSPYCDCGAIPGEEEEAANRCACCGKRIEL